MTRDLIDALFRHAEEMRRAWNKKGEDLGAPDPWEEVETCLLYTSPSPRD